MRRYVDENRFGQMDDFRYYMEDLHRVGGIPALLKYLLNEGLVDGSTLSVTGKTMAENLEGELIFRKRLICRSHWYSRCGTP